GQGKLQNMNRAGLNLFGITADEIKNFDTNLFYKDQEDRKRFVQEIQKNGFVKDFQSKLKRQDGTVMDCILTAAVRQANGSGEEYQGIIRDVSSQVKAKRELEEAFEKAQMADRVKSLFLANMSHEIRTPLNSILGFTDLIQSELRDQMSAEQQSHFEIIQRSGNRLMRTVHEVLDLSQIEAGNFIIKPTEFDLIHLLEKIIIESKSYAHAKNLSLTFISDDRSAIVYVDQYCVTEAVSNLVNNAIKYTEEGSIKVILKKESDHFVVIIHDTGIGMSEEYMADIFKAFNQESTGYTKKFQGVGLGLALTKKYTDLNNINIEVTSNKGVGTTVSLTFPPYAITTTRKNVRTATTETEVVLTRPDVITNTILLVEDDPGSRKLVRTLLKDHYHVITAETVEQAKEKLKTGKVHLALLDLSLIGNEDGLDLVRWMRNTKRWKSCPVIALTAHAFTTDRDLCLSEGCNDYLIKPIKKDLLHNKINALLQN
ncbi:MAG: ATP-binding protein, partial [Candidatus Neomarinimicrobiota bacterium]